MRKDRKGEKGEKDGIGHERERRRNAALLKCRRVVRGRDEERRRAQETAQPQVDSEPS